MPTLAQLYGAPKQAPTPLSSFAEETLTPIAEKLAPPTMPEVNPGIISLTGRALGGGLGAVGNLLDLPGSSVRDVLALRNPLDQWMDPLGYNAEENRVTGRDLLRQYGAVGEKDTWGNFAAGFAVDVATDPLSFTGIGNLNKAGTVAKNADMLGYAREVGNKTALDIAKDKAAKEGMTAKLTRPMRNVGSQSRVTTREIFDHLQKNDPDKYSELYQNWTNAGGTEDLLDMPLRDVASFRIPGLMKEAKTWRVKDAAADRADWSAKNSEFVGKPDLPNDPEAPVVDDVPDVDGGGGGTKTTDPVDPTDPAPTTQTTPTGVDPTGTQQSPFQIIRTKKGAVDYNKTRDAFRAISPNHEVFDEQLKAYEKGGALSKEESLLLQSVYSESDMEFANRMIGNVAEKESANGVIQPMASGYRVTLIPKGSSVKSPVSVLNHEMGHMAFFELEKTDSELFAAAQREIMEAIANGSLMKKFKITDGSVTGNMKLPGSPMRAEVQLAEYYQNKPHEVFAQLFSHAMDSKIPGDAIVGGGAVTELLKKAWEKIKSYVAKVIKSSDPNDPRLAAIEKLMDYTGGFKTADDRANILDALNNLKAQDGHSVKFFTEAGAQATGRTLMERAAARLGLMPPTDKTLLEDSYANAMFVEKETDGMFRVNIDEQKLKEAWPVNPSFKKPAVDPVNDPNNLVDVSNPAFTFESGKPAATLNSKLKQPNTLTPDDVEAAFEGIPTAQHGALAAFVRKLRPDLEKYVPDGADAAESISPRKNEDGFYYNVDRLIQSGKLGGRVGFEQLKATAKKFGVKDEEIDDLDLASLFSDGKPKTRDEIQQWVDDNKIEIKTIEDNQYQGYQIPGGDEGTYREVLISSAGKSGINTSGWTAKKNDYDEWDIFDANNEELISFPGESAKEAIAGAAKAMRENGVNPSGGPDYIGPHFRTPNVIAHLRMDDVTLPNGKKALRVQELQSDWHQTGKSKGYIGAAEGPKWTDKGNGLQEFVFRAPNGYENTAWVKRTDDGTYETYVDGDLYSRGIPSESAARESALESTFEYTGYDPRLGSVPDGPFKKNWTNLALKHVLKEAAEKGYDEVMIVKGEDAARAVRGPEDALGTFYDQILNSDMKKLTKKWGSFEGIGNIPNVSPKGEWNEIETLAGKVQSIGIGGTTFGDIEKTAGKYNARMYGRVGEYTQVFDSMDDAKSWIEDRIKKEYPETLEKKYSGDVQVFKVTPEMRRSLLEEGQAMYSLKPNPEKIKEAFQSFGKTWLSKVPEDSASAVADFIDRGGDLFYATTAGRALAGLFQADLFGAANSEIGREMGRARAKAMDEATIQFREAIDPAMTMLTKSGQMDMDTLIRGGKTPEEATAHVNKIANSIVRYFEGVDTLDDSINNPELIGALEAVRKIKDEVWQKVEDAGLKAPDLQDFFVKHFPRRKVDPGKSSMSINPRSGPVVEVSIDSQKRRDDLFRDIPGGTAVLNELSTDPVISGALHRPDFMKRKLSLEDMAVAKVEGGDVTMREYVYNQYGKDLLTEEKFDAFDPAKSTDLDRFIQYFADLDPKYADEGTALFGHNPIGDLANYMSDGNRVAEMAMTTQKLIARAARMEKFADAEPNKLHQIERLIGAGKGGLGFENTGKVLLNIAKNMEPEMQTAFKAALDNDVKKAMVELSQKKDVKRIVDGKEYVIKPKDVDANSNFSEIEVHYPKTVRELVNGEVVTKTIDDQPDIIDLASNPDYLKTMTEQYSAKKFLENFGVEDDIYKDATRFMKPWTSPEEYKVFERGLRRYINVMKAGLTAPWPAFHVRNFVSGSISNAMLGLTDPRYKKDPTGRALWQPIKDAYDLRANKPIDLRDIAGYNAKGADGKYILSDTEAMEKFQSEIFSMGIIGEKMGLAAEFIGDDLSSLASQKPGMNSEVNPLKGKFSPAPPNRTWFDYLNPLATRDGVTVGKSTSGNITPEVVRRDMFVGATAGKDVASFVEDLNRISGYIAARRQGAVPRAARAAVNKAQVDYSKLSSFESRYMRLLAPFYSYSRGMLPVTTMELIQNPGGPMATTIKLANRSRNPEEVVPDHIASTVGIPMGQTSDGSKRYLTGFGLGFEDSLNLLDGPLRMDPMATFRELGGRANPAIKGAIETMTGRSLFQDGPVGGKELTDLDPTIGRTLTNISDLVTGERTKKAEPFISPLFEQIVSNSPASRFASTARTLTDPRKWENPTTGLGLNILTGARVNDVSPQAQDVIYSERLAKELKAMGGRTYSRPYISDEREAEMTPEELARGQAILGEIDKLGKRFKARREEKEETEKIKAAVEKGT